MPQHRHHGGQQRPQQQQQHGGVGGGGEAAAEDCLAAESRHGGAALPGPGGQRPGASRIELDSVLNVKAIVATFNQEKALVGAFSVITNLRISDGTFSSTNEMTHR